MAGTAATYRISGLSSLTAADGSYTLTVDASKVADHVGPGVNAASVSWLMDATAPTRADHPVPGPGQPHLPRDRQRHRPRACPRRDALGTVVVRPLRLDRRRPVRPLDDRPASHPSATFVGQQGHTYAFQSIARDVAGNVEVKPQAVEAATFVPDMTPPTSRVTSVLTSSPTLQIDVSGSDAGGSGLDHLDVYVQVDGGPALQVGEVAGTSGTVTYQAFADGDPHTYRFYSRGVDKAGNVQPVTTDPKGDVVVTTTFSTPAGFQPVGLTVQHGASERSYVRYVDLVFNDSDELPDLIADGHVHLIRHNLDGTGATVVPLDGLLHVVDHAIEFDFGAAGLGGDPKSAATDTTRSTSTAPRRPSSSTGSSATSTATARSTTATSR